MADAERPSEPRRPPLRAWPDGWPGARGLAIFLTIALLGASITAAPAWIGALLAAALLAVILRGWRNGVLRPRSNALRVAAPASRADLNIVLDAIPHPTVLIDRRGNVMHANVAALSVFPGLRRDHPLAFAIRKPDMTEALARVLRGEAEASLEIVERVPVARSLDLTIRRLAPADPGLSDPVALIAMTDTSNIRRVEAMRVDFVANASHELRTPLASILGFIETLRGRARDDAKARESFLEIMENQARRMARLIDDLLSLSKIEMSAHIPPELPVDLTQVVQSVADALGGIARDRKVTLHIAGADQAIIVTGERDELMRAAENLIENAIKYGQNGGRVDIRLAVDRETPPGAITLAITDYGPGIPPEHLPRLTERFYRADVAESRVLGGTGLGLAIVKHIVARHRGQLQISSRPGEGATFSITLPLRGEE